MTTSLDRGLATPRNKGKWLGLIAVLLLGGFLRIANLPHRFEIRDIDEIGYMQGGLLLFEGVTPGNRVSPAATETWATWLYAAGRCGYKAIRPDPVLAQTPWKVRPFLVMDSVLFDVYHDMSGLRYFTLAIQFVIALTGIYAAFQVGSHYGGLYGGLLVGGLAACLPLFIDFAAMTRPYSDAWSFCMLAVWSSVIHRGNRQWLQTGLLMGLAVSSRIDLIAAFPIVLWPLWESGQRQPWRNAMKVIGVAMLFTLFWAPWLLMSPIGILRTITASRLGDYSKSNHPRLDTFRDVAWVQGLALVAVLIVLIPLRTASSRIRPRLLITAIAIALIASMFVGPYQPLRFHGAAILTIMMLGGIAGAEFIQRSGKVGPIVLGVLLILPLFQAIRLVIEIRSSWVPEDATGWIERNIPAGTLVYDDSPYDARCPLPTPQSADRIWTEVTDDQAWRKKFDRGLSRFGLPEGYLPRALSEDNLIQNRGLCRRFFILGGNPQLKAPRYNLYLYNQSPIFGVQDVAAEFKAHGGVVIWRQLDPPPAGLGTPVISWKNAAGGGTCVFCSEELKPKSGK